MGIRLTLSALEKPSAFEEALSAQTLALLKSAGIYNNKCWKEMQRRKSSCRSHANYFCSVQDCTVLCGSPIDALFNLVSVCSAIPIRLHL